jgi:hypothetical protein
MPTVSVAPWHRQHQEDSRIAARENIAAIDDKLARLRAEALS